MRTATRTFRTAAWAVLIGVLLLPAAGCRTVGEASRTGPPFDADALIRQLEATTAAWNAGDLEGFIAPYAEESTFMTDAGPISRAQMRARYERVYFDGSRAKQELRFEELRVVPLGGDHALMTGRFVLSGGDAPMQQGRFSLVWTRTADGWRILHDHSS